MFRLSGDFIYRLAGQLRPAGTISDTASNLDAYFALTEAVTALESLLTSNPLGLQASWFKGNELLKLAKEMATQVIGDSSVLTDQLESYRLSMLKAAFTTFEVTLKADLSIANLYILTTKGAYDASTLAEFGLQAFPAHLLLKVPEAANDAKQAARCIAFDLPTAAAFHLHRANEAVVHAYFKAIAPNVPPPVDQPLGAWLAALVKAQAPEKIVSALRDILKLHRNPVLHPQQSLDDSEEAIALLGSIHTAIRHMLQAIPLPEQAAAGA